jgi:hypothetical protein
LARAVREVLADAPEGGAVLLVLREHGIRAFANLHRGRQRVLQHRAERHGGVRGGDLHHHVPGALERHRHPRAQAVSVHDLHAAAEDQLERDHLGAAAEHA